MQQVGIGIIGCGNISGAYLKALQHFPILKVCGIADLNTALAEARAAGFNVPARTIDELWDAIRDALPAFSVAECANYFTATGYEPE